MLLSQDTAGGNLLALWSQWQNSHWIIKELGFNLKEQSLCCLLSPNTDILPELWPRLASGGRDWWLCQAAWSLQVEKGGYVLQETRILGGQIGLDYYHRNSREHHVWPVNGNAACLYTSFDNDKCDTAFLQIEVLLH